MSSTLQKIDAYIDVFVQREYRCCFVDRSDGKNAEDSFSQQSLSNRLSFDAKSLILRLASAGRKSSMEASIHVPDSDSQMVGEILLPEVCGKRLKS